MKLWFKPRARSIGPLARECRVSVVCVAILVALGCRGRPTSGPYFVVTHELTPEPARVGPESLTLQLKDEAGRAVSGAHIVVEAVMSHPGMAPVFADAKDMGGGKYRADVTFTMAGDWVILMHISLANGRKLERELKISAMGAK